MNVNADEEAEQMSKEDDKPSRDLLPVPLTFLSLVLQPVCFLFVSSPIQFTMCSTSVHRVMFSTPQSKDPRTARMH